MGSSQQPVTQQTTQTRDPWAAAQPFLQQGMNVASSYLNTDLGYMPWAGQTQIDPNTIQDYSAGKQRGEYLANLDPFGTAGIQGAQSMGTGLINNYGLSPEMQKMYDEASTTENPYLQNILDTQGRKIADRVGSSMAGAGRYGSGMHTDVLSRALAESADPILAQDYTRRQQQRQDILSGGLQRQGQWAQLMPTIDQARYANIDRLMGYGQMDQGYQQNVLADQIKSYNALQARPWEQLARYNAIVGGAGGLGGTQVTTQPGATQPSMMNRILGGAAAGAGIGSMFAPGVGTGIGALGGGLLGLM